MENGVHGQRSSRTQSSVSLVFFWISLVNLKRGSSLVVLVFSLSFPRILRVRQRQKILGNFEVFLDKTPPHPKKGQGKGPQNRKPKRWNNDTPPPPTSGTRGIGAGTRGKERHCRPKSYVSLITSVALL